MKRSVARVAATGEVVMALILLALGVVMSLVGLFAMATGYPMIEIERGWAMVITGAVLFSGGLIVTALGLVVRHLVGLRGALAAIEAIPQAAEAPVPQPMVVPTPHVTPLPAVAPVAVPEVPAVPPVASITPAAAAVPIAAAAPAAEAMQGREVRAHEAQGHEEDYAGQEHGAEDHLDVPPEQLHGSDHHVQMAHPAAAAAPDEGSAYPEPESTFDTSPESPSPADVDHAKASRDLLDEAFSAFDYEMANNHPSAIDASSAPHEPHAEPNSEVSTLPHERPVREPSTRGEPAQVEPGHPEAEHAEPEAHQSPVDDSEHAHRPEPAPEQHPVEAPTTAPAEPAANLAVIGRYDSEGTSYVMYSDGSIEAQSEAGVYRFGSMAELKAFIEG